MTIADELIALLERADGLCPLPRVAALHLPHPDLAGGKEGEFCALELEDGSIGLSYVLLDDTLAQLIGHGGPAGLKGLGALELADRYRSPSAVERTVGFAAINALTRCLFDRAGFEPASSEDSIGGLAPCGSDRIGMVGFFKPLIARVVASGAQLTVVELKPELAGEHPGFRVSLDPTALRACNKVLSTSTVLLNDTLDSVLDCCQEAAQVALVGPSAGCLPDPLFARGVTFVGGSWIQDTAGFVDALVSGASWSRHARKFSIEPSSYPGFESLLARMKA